MGRIMMNPTEALEALRNLLTRPAHRGGGMSEMDGRHQHGGWHSHPDGLPDDPAHVHRADTGELAWLREALTDEDEIAHGEAWHNDLGLGRCAYCNDDWPCRTQRGINRLLARLCQSGIDRCHECAVAAIEAAAARVEALPGDPSWPSYIRRDTALAAIREARDE